MKKIEELHKLYNVYPQYKEIYLSYNYNNTLNDWEFKGYHCTKCGRIVQNQRLVPRHYENCKAIHHVAVYKTEEIDPSAKVVNKKGELWKPLDFNQI